MFIISVYFFMAWYQPKHQCSKSITLSIVFVVKGFCEEIQSKVELSFTLFSTSLRGIFSNSIDVPTIFYINHCEKLSSDEIQMIILCSAMFHISVLFSEISLKWIEKMRMLLIMMWAPKSWKYQIRQILHCRVKLILSRALNNQTRMMPIRI